MHASRVARDTQRNLYTIYSWKDFKPRLKRLKELRQKQTELTVLEAQADYSLGGNRTMHEEDVAKMHQLEQRVAARRARGSSSSEGTLRTPTMSSERMAR